MHAIFRHSKLVNSDVSNAKLGNNVASEPTLSEGVYYVYNMGNYWNGGSHPGGSQFNTSKNKNYDLTSTLINQHGNNYNIRLMRDGNNGAKLVGIVNNSTIINKLS